MFYQIGRGKFSLRLLLRMGCTTPYGNDLGLWWMVITMNDLVINNDSLCKFAADFTASEVVYKE